MEELEIYKWFITQNPIIQALYAGLFTWGLTAIGASLVFLFNKSNRKILDMSLGFTGGVMIAASFWSLLSPAIAYVEMQNDMGMSESPSWLAPAVGFFLGALFLFILDKVIPHLHIFAKREEAEGMETKAQLFKAANNFFSSVMGVPIAHSPRPGGKNFIWKIRSYISWAEC